MTKKQFSPLLFLASLGAGGISVIPFALLQYTHPHGKGLINLSHINHHNLSFLQGVYFYSLEGVMVLFSLLHIGLSIYFIPKLFKWLKTQQFKDMQADPLKNSALLTPFISLVMTMNVFIGPIRFFIPYLSQNLQSFMLPAFLLWSVIWIALIATDIKLLKISFVNNFDITKIHFGWLLHPFALAMLTVTGTGIAAMGENPTIAHSAAFLSFVSGTMAFFLFVVKLITLFKSHFEAKGLPDKQFLPSMLSVIPIVTLFAISGFRIVHYFEHHHHIQLNGFSFFIVMIAYTFEVWYLLFGIVMLKDYIKKDFFKKEYYLSQWALVCPFVAFAVLSSFVYKVFVPYPALMVIAILSGSIAIALNLKLLYRHIVCLRSSKMNEITVNKNTKYAYNCS